MLQQIRYDSTCLISSLSYESDQIKEDTSSLKHLLQTSGCMN